MYILLMKRQNVLWSASLVPNQLQTRREKEARGRKETEMVRDG